MYSYASSGSDSGGIFDFGFFDPVLDFIQFVKDLFDNIIQLGELVATELIPAFVKLIDSIFSYFARLFDFIASFVNVPATPIPSSVMTGVNYVTNFQVGGVTVFSLVLSMLILFLSLRIVKKFVL
ncbi:MAG: hypothetical protein MI748_20175 [Opitutales bacterium]|nr:hypothetical protein [Opitutales bacterium]